jgi:hypothetical protein
MKTSLAHGSGYLEIDHRDSPGLTPADVAHMPGAVAVGPGEHFERDVQHCRHCERAVVLHPGRVRDRAVCFHCYHYICDECKRMLDATGLCVPFKARLEQAAEIAEKFSGQPDHPDANITIVLTDSFSR